MKIKVSLLVFVLFAVGCRQSVNTQNHFVLNAERAEEAVTGQAIGVLDVHRFTIDRAYDFKGFVHRKAKNEYEVDYYNGFLVSPSQMITERTRDWLSKTGLFERILNPGSQAEPTHALEGHIVKLYADFQDKHSAKAYVEIKCFLIDMQNRSDQVLLSRTYMESQTLDNLEADDLVAAMDLCLERILKAMETDIANALRL